MTGLTLTGATIRVNTDLNMDVLKEITPADASTPKLTWESLNQDIATISDDTGVVWGVAPGTATIRLTAVDAAGQTFEVFADVIVKAPKLSISGPTYSYVGTPTNYLASYDTVNDTVDHFEWVIKEGSNTAGAVLTVDPAFPLSDHASLVAQKSGQVTLIAIAKTKAFKEGTPPEEITVTFTNPVRAIAINGPDKVNVNEKITLKVVVVQPLDADPAQYVWTLEADGGQYADIVPSTDGSETEVWGLKITDLNKPVVVKASLKGSPEDHRIEATFNVNVGTRLEGLKLKDPIDIRVGATRDLFNINDLSVFPASIEYEDLLGKLTWSSSNEAVVSVTEDGGVITGRIKGSALITVTSIENPQIRSSALINVINEDRY